MAVSYPAALPPADLADVCGSTSSAVWDQLRGASLLLTGGTGFLGRWLLESFLYANDHLNLEAQITVLTRNAERFKASSPQVASHPAVSLFEEDVRNLSITTHTDYTHVLHLAAESQTCAGGEEAMQTLDVIVSGTRRILALAEACPNLRGLLFASSGAVYGKQPAGMTHIAESYCGGPDCTQPVSAYGEGKRMAELLCSITAQQAKLPITIARCFAFSGPGMPLDGHFALGNFIRDALDGGPIVIEGDGTPLRSYLYAADLAIWLWTILTQGQPGRAYNVGSDEAHALSDVAQTVAKAVGPDIKVIIRKTPEPGAQPARYIPNINRAQDELGLAVRVSLDDSIDKTLAWLKSDTPALV